MLASDTNNPQFAGAHDPDAVMIVRFYTRAKQNNFLSSKEGRPIFEDKIYCEYYPAGQRLLVMDIPAREDHKARFAKQWAYFQSTQKTDGGGAGTPLEQWAILSPADVENLRAMKFTTVDQIAAASDQQMQVLGMGMAGMAAHVFRARAQAYLGAAKDTALPQQQAAELAEVKRQLAEMKAMLAAKPSAETLPKDKPKRVWTPEQKAAAAERMAKARASKKDAKPQVT